LAGIAIESADGGVVEHLTFTNITMEGIITPIFICLNQRTGNGTGVIRDIHISNITAVAEGIIPCLITGAPGSRVSEITLRDISVEHNGNEQPMKGRLPENLTGYPENRMFGKYNPAGGLYIRHADNILVENFRILQRNTDYRPPVVLDDVTDIRIRELQSKGSESSVIVQAIECSKITLEGHEVPNMDNPPTK
jgi:Glycosyl hydrolases family 28.